MFPDGPGEDGCIDPDEVVLVEEVVDRLLHLVANLQARPLEGRPEPEVAVVQEKVHPVLLGLNGVVLRQGENVQPADSELVPPRSPIVGLHRPRYPHGAFLGEVPQGLPHRLRELLLQEDALDDPRSIPHHREGHLPMTTGGLHPAGQGHGLAFVGAEVTNLGSVGGHGGGWGSGNEGVGWEPGVGLDADFGWTIRPREGRPRKWASEVGQLPWSRSAGGLFAPFPFYPRRLLTPLVP